MKVVFFHRKPHPSNFSIENLFSYVRSALPPEITWELKQLKYFSRGLFPRFYIAVEAALNQADINHITGDVHFIALFLKKRKTVLTIHDVGLMKHPNVWARWILQLFWIILPIKSSCVITTVSESTKKELLKYVKIEPSRIRVIYDPISPLYKPAPCAFNKGQPTILQIGTKPNKNLIRLVQAIQGLSCKLEIIGLVDSALSKELEEAHVNYSNARSLTNEQILDKYKTADIISFVSTHEGFGMPIVEANAIGRVVVTSNVSSMPEIAGNAAHFVDPFDVASIRAGILKVIDDDAYREQLISNGFENSKRFDVRQIAQQYAEIYKKLESA